MRLSLPLALCLAGCALGTPPPPPSASAAASPPPGLARAAELDSLGRSLAAGNSWRITGVTLFDGEAIVDAATVVVKAGWIERVCGPRDASACEWPGLPTIDGQGKFLMPALIDAEGHFTRPAEMLSDLLSRDAPVCGKGDAKGSVARVSTFDLFAAFARRKLFTEVDTHGLSLGEGWNPRQVGQRHAIAPSANYEKHVRFGVTTVLDMAAYPWPANYVRRSRNQWGAAAPAPDLQKEFLVFADFYGSGMWAAPAGLQFGFYGTDPVYNLQPDGPWSERDVQAWVGRRLAEGSDHIKVFFEKWDGAAAPSLSGATLRALVRAAQAHGLQAYVHNTSESTSEDVAAAGADANIHTPGMSDSKGEVLSDAFAERFVRSVKVIVPTMTTILQGCANPYALANRRSHALSARRPGASFVGDYVESADVLPYLNALDEVRIAACGGPAESERVLRNTAKLYDHGATLLVGVDAVLLEPQIEGLGAHYEAYLIREALDRYSTRARGRDATLAALRAATSNAARAYGLHIEGGHRPVKGDPRGFVRPGYRADLLLLRASPLEEMLNTLRIDRVFKAGYLAHRQMVRPECSSGDCESRRIVREREAAPCEPAEPSPGG